MRAALVEHRPLVGQCDAARRAVEEAHPETLLEARDALADGGGRDAELASGGDEAARVGGTNERGQARQALEATFD